jgi:predicted HicB family RNase H-like nuclease
MIKGRTTKVIGVRVPIELYNRIDTLARKQLMSINKWCSRTLERESKPR